jgi:hypothetical protein
MPNTGSVPLRMLCIQATPPIAMISAPTEPMNGQGLGSIMW